MKKLSETIFYVFFQKSARFFYDLYFKSSIASFVKKINQIMLIL